MGLERRAPENDRGPFNTSSPSTNTTNITKMGAPMRAPMGEMGENNLGDFVVFPIFLLYF